MTPDEHAARAQEHLRYAEGIITLYGNSGDQLDALSAAEVTARAAVAQVHATLSLRPTKPQVAFRDDSSPAEVPAEAERAGVTFGSTEITNPRVPGPAGG